MRKERYCDYDKRNLSVVIGDRDCDYDKRNLSVVIGDRDCDYDKRNLSVVIGDTDIQLGSSLHSYQILLSWIFKTQVVTKTTSI